MTRNSDQKFLNSISGPVVGLVDLGSPFVALFCWGLLLGLIVLNDRYMPIGFWNSTDHIYVDRRRAVIAAAIVYYVVALLMISGLNQNGCKAKLNEAETYLYEPALPDSSLRPIVAKVKKYMSSSI